MQLKTYEYKPVYSAVASIYDYKPVYCAVVSIWLETGLQCGCKHEIINEFAVKHKISVYSAVAHI